MKRAVTILCLFSLALAAVSAISQEPSETEDLIAQADAAFDRWTEPFDFTGYRGRLETAVALWQEALPLIPEDDVVSRAHVLNRLAQAHFELGEAYLVDPAEREEAYGKGKDYALASLRLDPLFGETEEAEGFRAALRSTSDVEAIFWYGNTLGVWLNYHQVTAILGGVLDVLASYERSIELDETYLGGGPRRSMAALIAQAYFVVGKSRHDAVLHYERSVEIDPAYLESYVNYAQHYAGPMGERTLYEELLATALGLAEDPQIMGTWPLYNELAIRRAQSMLPQG
jgi:tetratricopeptide (TPR) repeat protein